MSVNTQKQRKRLPEWVKSRSSKPEEIRRVKLLLREQGLNTVCESARCPNIGECFARPTATFMIMGASCTRNCGFCSVSHDSPAPVEPDEPKRVAKAVEKLKLKHVVITSVTRDDLSDGGAAHFAACIREIRGLTRVPTLEVLTPDFRGNQDAIAMVVRAAPEIFNHNLETVPRLYPGVRPQADYGQSLNLLKRIKEINHRQRTKAGIMVGLGETSNEVLQVLKDLRRIDCDHLTVGQYLQPTRHNLPVKEYWEPERFQRLKETAGEMGFSKINCQPLARSSYHAAC